MNNRAGFRGGEENPYVQNYNTGGGAGGGGFLAGGSQNDSPSTKSAGNNFLRPVTIRQILNVEQAHPDADFMLDGGEIQQLTFVAVVRNISRNATNVAYSVEDGTGQIEVRQWLESADDDIGKASGIHQNAYVRILGQLKSFQNRRSVSAGHIRPVVDFNEVMYHRLDAVHHHLQRTKGLKSSETDGHSSAAAGATADMSAYSNNLNQNKADAYQHLPALSRKIMNLVVAEGDNSSEGVHVAHIARVLKGDLAQVREIVEELTSEGYLYTASDDDHVLPTGN